MANAPRRRIARPLLTVAAGAAAAATIAGCPMGPVGNLRACRALDGGFCFVPPPPPDSGALDAGDGGEADGGERDGGASDGGVIDGGDGG